MYECRTKQKRWLIRKLDNPDVAIRLNAQCSRISHDQLSVPTIIMDQWKSFEANSGCPTDSKKHHSKKRDGWHVCNNDRSLDDANDDDDDVNGVCRSVFASTFSNVW